MKNLEQIRARNAFTFSQNHSVRGKEDGEVIKKIPPLIMNHGLLAVLGYASDDKNKGHRTVPKAQSTNDGKPYRENNAPRWSLIRVANGGSALLNSDAEMLVRRSKGRNVEEHNRIRFQNEAEVLRTLANTNVENADSQRIRIAHSKRLLGLIQNSYKEEQHIVVSAKLEGRLAINLNDSLIENAGINLDRLFGLPYLPGSAVKGITRHTALESLKNASSSEQRSVLKTFCLVFGCSSNDFEKKGELAPYSDLADSLRLNKDLKGTISFMPAYPLNETRIVVDLTNVHYPDYYRSGNTTDQRKESPKPNPFPVVERGAIFAFPLILNGMSKDSSLLKQAQSWLEGALTIRGAGAKTASGYGWFSLCPEFIDEIRKDEQSRMEKAKLEETGRIAEIERQKAKAETLAKLSPIDRLKDELKKLSNEAFAYEVKAIDGLPELNQKAIIELFSEDSDKKSKLKTWRKKKPQNIEKLIATAEKLNLPLP